MLDQPRPRDISLLLAVPQYVAAGARACARGIVIVPASHPIWYLRHGSARGGPAVTRSRTSLAAYSHFLLSGLYIIYIIIVVTPVPRPSGRAAAGAPVRRAGGSDDCGLTCRVAIYI